MKRGNVHWVREQPTSGSEIQKKRPWVVIGANSINRGRRTIVAIPLSTSSPESPPIAFKVAVQGLLVVAVCDQIRAIDKNNFENPPIDTLSNQDMAVIEDSLKQVLGL